MFCGGVVLLYSAYELYPVLSTEMKRRQRATERERFAETGVANMDDKAYAQFQTEQKERMRLNKLAIEKQREIKKAKEAQEKIERQTSIDNFRKNWLDELNQKAAQSDPAAQFQLAYELSTGKFLPQDKDRSPQLLLAATKAAGDKALDRFSCIRTEQFSSSQAEGQIVDCEVLLFDQMFNSNPETFWEPLGKFKRLTIGVEAKQADHACQSLGDFRIANKAEIQKLTKRLKLKDKGIAYWTSEPTVMQVPPRDARGCGTVSPEEKIPQAHRLALANGKFLLVQETTPSHVLCTPKAGVDLEVPTDVIAVLCGCPPMKTIRIAGGQCHVYGKKVIKVFTHTIDGPSSDEIYIQTLGQPLTTTKTAEALCKRGKSGVKIHHPELSFGCACDERVVLFDSMSAPGTGSFVVVDATSGAKKFGDRHHDEPIEIQRGKIVYFSEVKEILQEKCPPEKSVGHGCRELEKVSLELRHFKKTHLGEKRISPIQ